MSAVPNREEFAAALPREWTDEATFKQAVRTQGRISETDNATVSGVIHSLIYYGLVQGKRTPEGGRVLRAVEAPPVYETPRRTVKVEVVDQFGDSRWYVQGSPELTAAIRRVNEAKNSARAAVLLGGFNG